jgi:hypothetical protein
VTVSGCQLPGRCLYAEPIRPPAEELETAALLLCPFCVEQACQLLLPAAAGPLPADNRIPWRGGAFFSDFAPGGVSLVGGYLDFGDSFVKYSYPIATTVSKCQLMSHIPCNVAQPVPMP